MAVHDCNPGIEEVEMDGSLGSPAIYLSLVSEPGSCRDYFRTTKEGGSRDIAPGVDL